MLYAVPLCPPVSVSPPDSHLSSLPQPVTACQLPSERPVGLRTEQSVSPESPGTLRSGLCASPLPLPVELPRASAVSPVEGPSPPCAPLPSAPPAAVVGLSEAVARLLHALLTAVLPRCQHWLPGEWQQWEVRSLNRNVPSQAKQVEQVFLVRTLFDSVVDISASVPCPSPLPVFCSSSGGVQSALCGAVLRRSGEPPAVAAAAAAAVSGGGGSTGEAEGALREEGWGGQGLGG